MRLFFYSLFSLSCLNLSSQTLLPFNINGKCTSELFSGKVYLSYEIDGKGNIDSCQIKNGLFSFSGKILHPVFAILSNANGRKSFFIEPKPITLIVKDAALKNVEVFGSNSDSEYGNIENQLDGIDNRWKIVLDTLDRISARSITQFQELKEWVLQPYFEEIRETYLNYFKNYPQSFVTAYFLSLNVIEMNQGVLPTDSLQAFYQKFEVPIKKSWYGKKILEELSNRQIAVPGTKAFDFTKTDKDGHELLLQSFRGKYVLLDFWGSWCIPCRKSHPHLKAIYNQYKDDGFEIIGIAKEYGSKNTWLKAIEKDSLPWQQILCDSLDIDYNITSFPTKILIDKEGTIIGRYGEETTELDNKLKTIFNKRN
ncbi:MAG TPA: TlpA disulfide reductase family protein [Chitinophagaceae bacterium]|nr:TlpA disulfide reductase family protein [Chitinophagaceae bacterium]